MQFKDFILQDGTSVCSVPSVLCARRSRPDSCVARSCRDCVLPLATDGLLGLTLFSFVRVCMDRGKRGLGFGGRRGACCLGGVAGGAAGGDDTTVVTLSAGSGALRYGSPLRLGYGTPRHAWVYCTYSISSCIYNTIWK